MLLEGTQSPALIAVVMQLDDTEILNYECNSEGRISLAIFPLFDVCDTMQNIEGGMRRYVGILKRVSKAMDSASQQSFSFAYLEPDFISYTAALLMHIAPFNLAGMTIS